MKLDYIIITDEFKNSRILDRTSMKLDYIIIITDEFKKRVELTSKEI